MKKSFLKIVLVGTGNVFNAVLGFAFLSVVAKTLDLESFGKYALLYALLVAISKLIDFGTNSVYVAKSISNEDKTFLDTFYTIKFLLFLVSIPISILILLAFKINDGMIIFLFIFGLFAYLINYTLNAFFQKMEKFIHLVSLNTFPAIIKGTFAALIYFEFIKLNLVQSFAVFSISLFTSAILIFFLPKKYKIFKIDFSKVRVFLKESYPAGISQLIYEGWPSISNSIAKIAKDFSNVGIFFIAEKISNILGIASISVFTVLLPKNARRKKKHEGYDFKEIYTISFLIILSAFFGILISRIFVSQFLGEKFSESIPLLGFMIFAGAFSSIHTFMEHYFYIEEKTKYIMFINIGKLSVFLILSWILIPAMSLKGLALANLISAFLALISTFIIIGKDQKGKLGISKIQLLE